MTNHGRGPIDGWADRLFQSTKDAIFLFDESGIPLASNSSAEELLAAGVGNQIERSFLDARQQNAAVHQLLLTLPEQGTFPYAAAIQRIDADEEVFAYSLRNISTLYQNQEKLYQNRMMKHVIEAQEKERRRLSRELHDSVAQELMSAVVDVRVLKHLTKEEALLKKMNQTEALMTRLLDDIRNLSVELRPATLDDFGLEAAFKSHFKRMEQRYGLLIDFRPSLPRKRYSSEIETVVYRVCQEAVLNALKYAEVDSVTVTLTERDEVLELVVEDHGTGFHPNAAPIGTGLGLYGMRERAELVNGVFHLQSRPNEGTSITLRVPAADRN
ncbi:sensor histidine kinase [Gorillibacterium sp. CAU 1737]|uniref:sensor histidine kinase n=1 Tax=Gorillibacterium sp. CAU 1737 TaxID=3140362 RepID=UPI0032604F25